MSDTPKLLQAPRPDRAFLELLEAAATVLDRAHQLVRFEMTAGTPEERAAFAEYVKRIASGTHRAELRCGLGAIPHIAVAIIDDSTGELVGTLCEYSKRASGAAIN